YCVCKCRWVNSGMNLPSFESVDSLSPRARAIQRKSIHTLSTGADWARALASCALLAGCAGSGPAPTTNEGDQVLVPDPVMTTIRPGAVGSARFVLTGRGLPSNKKPVNFSIVEDPGGNFDPKGSTLADTSATTDESGVATVDVLAGNAETTFLIQA